MTALRLLGAAARCGWRDRLLIFTWRTWTGGWLVRMVAQVSFFALLGVLLASPERVQFLVVGNAVMAGGVTAMFVVPMTAWERMSGTLPLLVAAPRPHVYAFLGRGLVNVGDGVVTGSLSLLVVAWLFGVDLPAARLPGVLLALVVVAASTYCFGAFLGALVLRALALRNLVSNFTYLTMMVVCGVNVPTEALPTAIATLSRALPLTNGLLGIRSLVAGEPSGDALRHIAVEGAVGLAWLGGALTALLLVVRQGRRNGSIDFDE